MVNHVNMVAKQENKAFFLVFLELLEGYFTLWQKNGRQSIWNYFGDEKIQIKSIALSFTLLIIPL